MTPADYRTRLLGLLSDGSGWKLPDLSLRLRVSDATVARALAALEGRVLSVGERRGRRYFARRQVRGLDPGPIPVYRILPAGRSELFARLTPIGETGYYCNFEGAPKSSRPFDDLPYFLEGLRPAGYLGRQIPARHPELEVPDSITYWSGDDVLRYLTRFGSDGPGDFIVGETAFELYLEQLRAPAPLLRKADRGRAYSRRAGEQLKYTAGSSAAGEQPKFLSATETSGPVLVKFSPPTSQVVGRRIADLLICEHLALETLHFATVPAARSEILIEGEMVFLEIARFDRTELGRRGVIHLGDLGAEWVGSAERDWLHLTTALVREKLLPRQVELPIRFLAAFGRLIANTDMHAHNLAFCTSETDPLRPERVAPAYDMSPMLYSPRQGHVTTPALAPPMPSPADGPIWLAAAQMATFFWESVSQHELVSKGFREIATENIRVVRDAAELAARLPQ